MKRAIAFIAIAVALATLGPARADEAFTYAGAGASCGASWVTDGFYIGVSVAQGARVAAGAPSADTVAYLSYYEIRHGGPEVIVVEARRGAKTSSRPHWCETEVTLQPGQWTLDPTLASATLDVPSSQCGAVHVDWTGVGDPKPYVGGGASTLPFFFGTFVHAGGGASINRQATAKGRFASFKLVEADQQDGGLAVGAGSYSYLLSYPTFVNAGMFKGMSVQTRQRGYTVTFEAYEWIASAGVDQLSSGVRAERVWGCIEVLGPFAGRFPRRWGGYRDCGPVSLTMDPAMNTANVVAAWGRLKADVTFTATGDPTPENDLAPPPDVPSPENPIPGFFVGGDVYASRVATTAGKISTSAFGAFSMSAPKAVVCEGMNAVLQHGFGFWFEE